MKVGNIQIVRLLGTGGMGSVYLGYDERLDREVAVKAIRHGNFDPAARSRFLREARALSRFDHPHICKIYGYLEGESEDFLVLERVDGGPLRDRLREGPPLNARLEIAEQIAAALMAAHAKGIIHRDLKMDNVMVAHDGKAKVLDFGLARLQQGPSSEFTESWGTPVIEAPDDPELTPASYRPTGSTAVTQEGRVLGTLACLSPEQLAGDPATPASDCYALGLLFQELFTGRPAFDPNLPFEVLVGRAAAAETLPVTGLDRELAQLVGDLKARAPEKRPTASEALVRLRRRRDRDRRRLRRTLAAAAAVLLAAAALKYTLDLRRERNAAVAARRQADRSSAEAQATTRFVLDLFEVSAPERARGASITARELLDRGAEAARQNFHTQPLIRARMEATIGGIYTKLGLFPQAESLLGEALAARGRLLGPEAPEVAESLVALGDLHQLQNRPFEPEYRRALAIQEKALGPESPAVATTLHGWGGGLARSGRYSEAEPLLQRALAIRVAKLRAEDPAIAVTLHNLAGVKMLTGHLEDAESYLRQSLAIRRAALPPIHPDLAASLESLGFIADQKGRPREAEGFFRQSLAIWEKVLGPEHPNVARNLCNLGESLCEAGRWAEAKPLFLRSLAISTKAEGPRHPSLGLPLIGLADVALGQGDTATADRLLRQAVSLYAAAGWALENHLVRVARLKYAERLRASGREREAEEMEAPYQEAPAKR